MKRSLQAAAAIVALLLVTGLPVFAGGQGESGAGAEEVTISIALPNNPISQGLADLAEEHYEAEGVTLQISVLPENDLRSRLLTEASTDGTTYDMFVFGPYEALNWAKFGWLENLEPYFDALPQDRLEQYDRGDLIPAMQESLSMEGDAYALPFYGESAFVMYNKKLFEEHNLTMPEQPTWDQLYEMATTIHDDEEGTVGMTMRGAPGWGMVGAPFVPMVNAYGGRFYDMDWNATVDTPEQRAAWQMFKKILVDAGQEDIVSYTYNEAIALMQSGNAGIYFDATSIAPPLESSESKIAGDVGYALPPRGPDHVSQWLWNWAFGINPNVPQANKEAVFDFMLWATSKEYIELSYQEDPTGAITPPASRASTYVMEGYADVPYADITLETLEQTEFDNPTVDPVPYQGLQYIAIPEFTDLGDSMTERLAAYIVGDMSLDEAIRRTQEDFDQAAVDGGYR